MKIITTLFACLICSFSFGQKANIEENKQAILKDESTHCTYILDKEHKHITAYDSKGKKLWVFSTNISSINRGNKELVEIDVMEFRKIPTNDAGLNGKSEKGIFVAHTNCLGYITLNNGKYTLLACD